MFTPNSLHHQAFQLREQAQSAEALSLYEKALVEYIGTENSEGIIRVLLEKETTYRHLWFFTEKTEYIELSAVTLQVTEHIFHRHEDHLTPELNALVLFHVAQVSMAVDELQEANEVYQQSLDLLDPNSALYGNVLSHLAQSEWLYGEPELATTHFAKAHALLEKHAKDADEYTSTVWLSGSLLRQAECLGATNPQKALEYLSQAKELLNSETYPIRWKQLEKLETSIGKK